MHELFIKKILNDSVRNFERLSTFPIEKKNQILNVMSVSETRACALITVSFIKLKSTSKDCLHQRIL